MEEKIDAIAKFIRKGWDLEGNICKYGENIRKLSKENFGEDLLDSRSIMTSIFAELVKIREGIPGETNESLSQRIHLIAGFIQGIDITEAAISEGQYLKAAAIEKQNYETLARICEVKKGVQKPGQNPQIQFLPEGFRRVNGDLNKIAHPSNDSVIQDLLGNIETDLTKSVSYLPEFRKDTSRAMYELHLVIMFNIIVESIQVLEEMYGEEIIMDLQEKEIFRYMDIVKDKLEKSGAI